MQLFGGILILLGAFVTLGAIMNAGQAPDTAYLVGTFLPGAFLLLIGLAIGRQRKPRALAPSVGDALVATDAAMEARSNGFKTRANWGVGGGILIMLGSVLGRPHNHDNLLMDLAFWLGGWALVVWGCGNYMRWKGYSGWLGMFGYLFLPGLIVLVCFPNRRKRLLKHGSENVAALNRLSQEDRKSGFRYLLMLLPIGLLLVGLGALFYSWGSNIDAAEWKSVDPVGGEFQALMPGTARLDQQTPETAAGKMEIHKFMVEPKGKKELYLIVAIRFPEVVGKQLGGREKLLALGRKDLLDASKGQIQSERPIVLGNLPGVELEVLPPAGAVIKARIFATDTQIYQVMAHVPRIRLHSNDVEKYLDSFRLTAAPTAGPELAK